LYADNDDNKDVMSEQAAGHAGDEQRFPAAVTSHQPPSTADAADANA